MTVCIAAICEGGTRIIGASDRMLTAEDMIEFEPPQTKIWALTSSIIVMASADTCVLTEILKNVELEVKARISSEPEQWWRVRDIAELYSRRYQEFHFTRAENVILKPLGLNRESFINAQRTMDPKFVHSVGRKLADFKLPGVSAIFVGIDNDGPQLRSEHHLLYPHIYSANGSELTCQDTIAFAAIGVGAWHAESQFMSARHTRQCNFPETLLLTYSAKKCAEVAPGVGKWTDMFSIGPGLGASTYIEPHLVNGLERIYQRTRKEMERVNKRAEKKAKRYIEEITRSPKQGQQTAKGKLRRPLSSCAD